MAAASEKRLVRIKELLGKEDHIAGVAEYGGSSLDVFLGRVDHQRAVKFVFETGIGGVTTIKSDGSIYTENPSAVSDRASELIVDGLLNSFTVA